MSEEGFKEPVRLATTAAITLAGEQTIDGVTTSEDRVLVKDQSTQSENGIYVSSSGAWQRARDFDGYDDFTSGTAVLVAAGSVNAGKQFYCSVSDEPPQVGTSTITWTQVSTSTSLGGDLTAIEALSGTGIARRTGTDTWTVGDDVVNADLADMADSTIKGVAVGSGTSAPVDLTGTQATAILDAFVGDSGSGGTKGLVPAPGTGDATKVLKGDGTWGAAGGDLVSTNNLNDVADAASAFGNIKQAATETDTGVVEYADDTEIDAGTATDKAVTVAGLTRKVNARTESIIIDVTDEAAVVTAGTNKRSFRMPYALTLTGVRASLSTAQTSGSALTVDINASGSTVISPKLTFDNAEKTTTTATTAATITDTSLADDEEIVIDVDAVGDGTAKGLKVTLIGTRP